MSKRKHGKNVYQEDWEHTFKWLKMGDDRYSAYCKLCKGQFAIDNGGKAHVISHSKGKKHSDREKIASTVGIGSYFSQGDKTQLAAPTTSSIQPAAPTTSSIQPAAPTTSSIQPVALEAQTSTQPSTPATSFTRKMEVTRAELIFLLGSVKASLSSRASDSIVSLLPVMFPDSSIASEMSLARTKYSYLLCFGVSPYLEQLLVKHLHDAKEIVVLFDESLNKISQKCQLDLLCRFWDAKRKIIVTRYFGSVFLGCQTADDLLKAFCDQLEGVGIFDKIISVSMDGPNTNWSFMTKLQSKRKDEHMCKLIDVGSCGLHVVHGAAKTGYKATKWNVCEVLSAAYYLFKDSPKRRSDFTKITSCSMFPLKYCSVRWVENVAVAKRFLDLIPHLQKYCSNVMPKPDKVSFTRVQEAVSNHIFKAKLHFFISVSSIVEPFLRRFQSSEPLFPFLCVAMTDVQTEIAQRYLKSSAIPSSAKELSEAIMSADSDDYLSITDIGIGAKIELDNLRSSGDTAHAKLILAFRSDCRKYLEAMSKKLAERSPIRFPVVRYARAFDPDFILTSPSTAKSLLENLAKFLAKENLLSVNDGDEIVKEFGRLIIDTSFKKDIQAFKKNKEDLKDPTLSKDVRTLKEEQGRLDVFYYNSISSSEKYDKLWGLILKILILSHGNASVESGFSIQGNQLFENLHDETMVARRRVYDAVSNTSDICDLVTPTLIKATKGANSRYNKHLEEKRTVEARLKAQEVALRKEREAALLEARREEARAAELLQSCSKRRKELEKST